MRIKNIIVVFLKISLRKNFGGLETMMDQKLKIVNKVGGNSIQNIQLISEEVVKDAD